MENLDDLDILAARAAISAWKGNEGTFSQEIQGCNRLSIEILEKWLAEWMLSRSVPKRDRDRLLAFLNDKAIPAFRNVENGSGEYEIVEELSRLAVESEAMSKRPTSLISKFGLTMSPEIFVPYDSRVRKALKLLGHKIPEHGYVKYMTAVLAEKPAFLRTFDEKGLTATRLGAGEMSQSLFEMRALDKRLMLEGGFSPKLMARGL
jgi:hypothetical protein